MNANSVFSDNSLFSIAVENARDEFEQRSTCPDCRREVEPGATVCHEPTCRRGLIAAALASHDARVTA